MVPVPSDPVRSLADALAAQIGSELELERPAEAEHGDYATNVALRLAGARRRPPRELAAEIAAASAELEFVERAEVAGPGFVNVFLRDEWFSATLDEILAAGDGYGSGVAESRERVQVEMVSANPTGPILVSHARNGAYGDSVARLLEAAGHTVEREYYYNDSGGQMDRFRASVKAVRAGAPIPEDGYHGDYIKELAATDGDPVPAMLESMEATLERFRIHFDSWALQSVVEPVFPTPAETRHVRERRRALGALIRLGDDEDRVLLRSEGRTPTYAPPTFRISSTSSSAASTARSTCSAPTITAHASGTRPSRGCSATTRRASRSCCTSLSI